ncbi:FUSC family protein [Streptomyces sp. BH106]|uniref:FUSC family protein n=1 Tax=Streptomyces sp. BH106 TaxID=3410409 RepID=UPI003CE9749A
MVPLSLLSTHHGLSAPPRGRLGLPGLLALNPGPWLWGQAALVAVTGAALFSGGFQLAGLTCGLAVFIGGWNVMLEQRTPGAHRRRLAPVTGAALVLSAMAGFAVSAAHAPSWVVIAGGSVLTAGCYYVCQVLRAAPPGGYLYLLAYVLCSTIPVPVDELPRLAAWAAGGAAAGWLVILIETLLVGRAAEYRALARVFRSLAALIAAADGGRTDTARHAAVADLDRAWDTVRRGVTARMRRTGEWDRLIDVCQYAAAAVAEAGALADGARPSPAAAARAAECRSVAEELARDLLLRARRGPLRARIAEATGTLEGGPAVRPEDRLLQSLRSARHVLDTPEPAGHHPLDNNRYPSLWSALAAGAQPGAVAWRYALRSGGAVFAAGALTHLAGISRPGWAMLAAGSVLLAPGSVGVFNRAVQRSIGTLIGLVATAGVLALHPGTWTVLLLASTLVGLAQPFLAKNSGLAIAVLTPGVVPLSYPGDGAFLPILDERLQATAIGSAVALLLALTVWRRPGAEALRGQLTAVLRALATEPEGPHATRRWRRTVLTALQNTGDTFQHILGDVRPPRPATALWPVFLAVQRLGFQLIAHTPSAPERAQALPALRELAEAVAEDAAPRPVPLPPTWATPDARDALRRLRSLLGEGESDSRQASVIRGQLRDPDGALMPHTAVTLIDPSGTQADAAYTDAEGRFTIHPRAAGRHLLVASTDGRTAPEARALLVPSFSTGSACDPRWQRAGAHWSAAVTEWDACSSATSAPGPGNTAGSL